MDAMVVKPYRIRLPGINRRIAMHNPGGRRFIVSVLADKNTDTSSLSTSHDDESKNVIYQDSFYDRLAINHLSQSLQAATGRKSKKSGYDGLVEAATMASRRFSPIEQREVVIQTLLTAFPKPILSLIKIIAAPSKFTREFFATFTTIFFAWLVGPCEVKESEIDGRKEKNVVHIQKCRFLEESNCVGMCTNLCKMPSQMFIKDYLGIPINMVPNFDDMSCELIFGQEPPPQDMDPAFTQPCYKQCKEINKHKKICIN
ncbi:hypothetical protein ACJIZ3_016801 [Penstemon smallii]|uniref:Beta-carotene isomerase D27-like C-terminal domain-containing protein n=1 Tax=Penstemon smallii TaxID=265156 RepID=A0ABD3STR6_9LAMI